MDGAFRFDINQLGQHKELDPHRVHDQHYVVQVLLAHCVYLINVVGQMFFTDAFLGYEFSK